MANYRINRLFKKTTKRKTMKPQQWYRPGHGRMATFTRRGASYNVTGSRSSQYKPRRQFGVVVARGPPVPVSYNLPPSGYTPAAGEDIIEIITPGYLDNVYTQGMNAPFDASWRPTEYGRRRLSNSSSSSGASFNSVARRGQGRYVRRRSLS